MLTAHRKRSRVSSRAAVVLLALGLVLVGVSGPWSGRLRAELDGAAISRSGVLGGARYLIEAPANWKGGLVVFAHGIQRGPGPGAVAAPPMAGHILASGHAWAASGYRAREYQPHLFIEDTNALRELVVKELGPPRWTIIYGQSMGGHIVVASLELHPGLYQGGLAECGLVDGISIADYLMAYTAAAELISAVPLLDAPDQEAFARMVNEGVVPALGMPGAYTARGRQFDSVVKYLMGADQAGNDLPMRLQGLKRRYLLNLNYRPRDVENSPNPGSRAARTAHIRYRIDPGLGLSEDELNVRVRRIHPAKDARSPSANPVYAERTGRLTVPLLTLHETGDAWVPLSLEQSYRRRSIAAGTDHLLVQRVMRAGSHCGFDGDMREQAFDDLVAWIERGVRPAGEDVLAADLSRIGLKWTGQLHPEDPLALKQ
jgi:pimeloyl-ACP methyl ester carboxylesterase